jgi:hypothetical protein
VAIGETFIKCYVLPEINQRDRGVTIDIAVLPL